MTRRLGVVASGLALIAPIVGALALVYASGHGIRGAAWVLVFPATAVAIAALVVALRRHRVIGACALVAWLGVGALWWTYRAAPLPPVAAFEGELPAATPPPELGL